MKKLIISIGLILLLGQESRPKPAPEKTPPKPVKYSLVINPNNPYKAKIGPSKAFIRKLYLKQTSTWPLAGKARPFGRSHGSASQRAFETRVLGMSPAVMARHWLRLKNLNGSTPPMILSSDHKIAKFVKKYKGAFGWVESSRAKKTGLTVLFEF